MTTRLAIDIGGTFTDLVLDRDGKRTACKLLTTQARPADGIMAGIAQILGEAGAGPDDIDLILHGTTLATNALIERKGAVTALIVTEGHRDSVEMAYENRFDQYDINAERPPPLVPRARRLPVAERINFKGEILTPLDEQSVLALIPQLREARVESVAIGLLHAYADPSHEQRVAAILAEALPDLSISLSSEVCPEIREYERQSTTCANAYIQRLMAGYLTDLERRLAAGNFRCPLLLMTSGGNVVTVETAVRYPIRLVESGPAGGAIMAAHIARRLGEDRVFSFDMGGTTAKICLIDQGEPLLSRGFEVARAHRFMKGSGMPIKVPVVEMVEIGAGGGSIASVDSLARIRVGPESAASDPGPACYGLGGDRPTVTDANLIAGRLHGPSFAGGRMALDEAAAAAAVRRDIGEPLSLDTIDGALGVLEVVDENMASAARVHAVERGEEIEGRTLIAFGGAGPLHAARLAEKLGIDRIIVPNNAGVGSAIGFLLAPVAYEVARSSYMRLDGFDPAPINNAFEAMAAEAEAVVRLGAPESDLTERRYAYARYVGQGHEVKIAAPVRPLDHDDGETLRLAFETAYGEQYGRAVPGLAVEVLTWSLTLSAPAPATRQDTSDTPTPRAPQTQGLRPMRLPGRGAAQDAETYDRQGLVPGDSMAGPAAITESQTTTIVPDGFTARINGDGDIILERRGAQNGVLSAGVISAGVIPEGAVRNQILWDRLIAIVEEQAQSIIRTAFSTTVREAGDLSAGLFDRGGRMLAQAVTGTPGHVNAMAAAVLFFLEKYPIETMAEGDVFVTNDPWHGTGHLFDFTVVSPVFVKGAAVGLFASTVHVVDIGGPGFGPDAGQVYEEGLCIPIMHLFKGGVANQSLFDIVRANVREPVQVTGDLYSLAASNGVGAARLAALMSEFGLNGLDGIGDHIIETSRAAMIDHIRALPRGRYDNAMTVDGYESPVHIEVCLTVTDDGIKVDFAGSSPMSPYGINVPITYAQAYASFGIRCVVGSAIPNNTGSLSPIQISAPEGCILNAPRPAAVTVRHVIGQMLPDVVLGALEKAQPGIAPAEGSSSLWNPMLSGGHGMVGDHDYGDATEFSVTIFHSGGTGARPAKDGLSATAFPSGVRNTPVEITESIAPILYLRKEYRTGSGGAGSYRGGDGQIIEIGHAEGAPFAVFALFDRIGHPARGRNGGGNGKAGRVGLASGATLKGMGKQIVPAGDRLILELPGGGGLGKPD